MKKKIVYTMPYETEKDIKAAEALQSKLYETHDIVSVYPNGLYGVRIEAEEETPPAPVDVDTTVKLNTLDTIARLMDGKEWDSSTTSAISEELTRAGYIIREPLLASDFGELDPEEAERRHLTDAGGKA